MQEVEFWRLVRADWRSNAIPTGIGTLLTARWWSVFLYRVSAAASRRSRLLGAVVKQINQFLTGADISPTAGFGGGLVLFHPVGVVVGPGVTAGRDCHLQQGVTLGTKFGELVRNDTADCPLLGDRVRIGAGARILGRVAVGNDTIVGANAVLLQDTVASGIYAGVPARMVGSTAQYDSSATMATPVSEA